MVKEIIFYHGKFVLNFEFFRSFFLIFDNEKLFNLNISVKVRRRNG